MLRFEWLLKMTFSWFLPAVPPFNIEMKKAPFRCLFSQNPPESWEHLVHSVSKDVCLLTNFTLQWEKSRMRFNRLNHLWPADIDILDNRLIQPDFSECLVRSYSSLNQKQPSCCLVNKRKDPSSWDQTWRQSVLVEQIVLALKFDWMRHVKSIFIDKHTMAHPLNSTLIPTTFININNNIAYLYYYII